MQAAQHPQPQLLIFSADAFHAVVGEFPFREKQRFFLAEKTIEILGKAGGGGFIGGEKEGAFSQRLTKAGGKMGLMDGGKAIQQQGAFALPEGLTGGGKGGEVLEFLKHGGLLFGDDGENDSPH